MASVEAQELISRLGLEPLEGEGGYYRNIFLDTQRIPTAHLGNFVASELPLSSVIYYLMTKESFSALHWLAGLEVWTWIAGDPVEQVIIHPGSVVETRILGFGPERESVSVVLGNSWQGSRILADGTHGYALCSTVMNPAYHPDDFVLADRSICMRYPEESDLLLQFLPRGAQ
ncbi:cupin domain-containing protein [Pleomorphochaeta sp. DL1XJH-081]|uniref:cupin domain-containing protein n=1 Tax=Pleomorphochaeta sp. DL1XJH-081 TaxID=3409690 RepID=UPI003BB5973C